MKLKGRNLRLRMTGEDVTLLQSELRQLGYSITDRDGYFGKSTHEAVVQFQKQHGLEVTGEVDERTALLINEVAVERQDELVLDDVKKIFEISGHVIDHQTGQGVEGLRIETWDKDIFFDDFIGSAETDAEGAFEIQFNEDYFKEIVQRKPDIFFKISYGDEEIPGTEFEIEVQLPSGRVLKGTGESVFWKVAPGKTNVTIKMVISREEYTVKGTVTDLADNLVPNIQVQAFQRYLRKEMLLGSGNTDARGAYTISYSVSDTVEGCVNLALKVFGQGDELLHQTAVYHNVPKDTKIDVQLPIVHPGFSEFERMVRTLQPLLENGLTFADLEQDEQHDDIRFLAGKTGLETSRIARLSLAYRLSNDSKIMPEFWYAVLALGFYGTTENLSLQGQYKNIRVALPSVDGAAVRKALNSAISENVIPPTNEEQVTGWIAEFLEYAARQVISAGDEDTTTFVKQVLEEAGITTTSKQLKFSRLFQQYRSFSPALIEDLSKDSSFKSSEIDDIHTSFRLAEITNSDFSIVKVIKTEFDVRQPASIRTLAKKSEEEWINVVDRNLKSGELKPLFEVEPLPVELPIKHSELYGKQVTRQFQAAFPTSAFTSGLERALQSEHKPALKHAEKLKQFLNANPEFEILNTSIDTYFQSEERPNLEEYRSDMEFQLDLKAVQRIFKLAPNYEATDALLADDLHSARKIYCMGESEFVRTYKDSPGFDEKSARMTWNKAADTHAAVVMLVSELKDMEYAGAFFAFSNVNEAVSDFPNWNNLFRTGDICECEHCRSVLSPAAYFADLLMFLKHRKAKPSNSTIMVKDIILKRRPDLGYIELNCENALTILPYIDVVCEVLEDVVAAGENDVELIGLTAINPNLVQAEIDVRNAFPKGIPLSSDFTLSPIAATNRWVLHSDEVTYLLKKKVTANYFAEILRNTKTKTDELRANPQYVNPKAYDRLKAAKYPFALPFDLFNEEAQAAFRKAGLKRWELMQIFRGTAAPNNPDDGEIAAVFFGISVDANVASDEKRIITQSSPANQYEFWGEPDNATMIANLTNVKTFLQKTGLEYNDLLTLLDLKFINPDGSIQIVHLDATCDTEQKEIRTMDANKLDRIHRFLRLWCKLKDWKMWEVDLVIRHPHIGNGNLDNFCLINLMYFMQTKDLVGKKTTVEQCGSLFDCLNTETHFTRLHEKREDALYQNLFLNRKFMHPLDLAFEIDPVTNDIRIPVDPITGNPAPPKISEHLPVILAALRIKESELIIFMNLTQPSVGTNYIDDNLTLSNLSFLYRHSWLARQLKFKADEWRILLKLINQGLPGFADPQAAKIFLEQVEALRKADFSMDELNYLLSADQKAKAAVNDQNAGRFLLALRKELQGIAAEYDSAKYPFLQAVPPTDVEQLSALLTTLLQKLNRDEAAVKFFLATLLGSVLLETKVQDLQPGFTFPVAITSAPNHIPIQYDEPNKVFHFTGIMTSAQQITLLNDASLTAVKDKAAYQSAIKELFQQSLSASKNYLSIEINVALPGGVTLPNDRPSIPIRYNATTGILSFIGLMTNAEQSALKAIQTNPGTAIDELFYLPRLAMKFYESVFTAPLQVLPPAVDFKKKLPASLSARISYDEEQRLLCFAGIMRNDEKTTLDALSTDVAYRNAVNNLATQPQGIAPPDKRIWLMDNDLDATQLANDSLAKRLANACQKGMSYLKRTHSENTLILQLSTQMGLTPAVVRKLVTTYQLLPPDTILQHFTESFAISSGAIDYLTFDTYFWLFRVSLILKKWKIELSELEWMITYHVPTQTLDFKSLPIDSTKPVAPLDQFIRTSRLFRFRERLDESQITLLKVLKKLHTGAYPAKLDFTKDVYLLKEWNAEDVKKLTESLDLNYPADYLLAENWERLSKAIDFLDKLNASTDTVKAFANPTVEEKDVKILKQLLRSRFGAESWLMLSTEIQDILRERKRDALVAWLLTQPQPMDAPSGKWENTNDVYAYYLFDVEMTSCMQTSRLVQASGSVQLFVQRCMMGLEPEVVVKADGDDGDSAWRWWKWMRKYRVWEANRKVFLYPENWIEPELRRDKSSFFKDLENELLQNEVNQYTVETAFLNYLEKLDNVAQLEIANFYHEDDADRTIIHVFGRTKGAEPHVYYYRQYDYRRWTPWEKVDLDIAGDYLIPAVVNKRLFLFWPVFTEIADEAENKKVDVPAISTSEQKTVNVKETQKKLRMQIAVSEYRNGKWTPKKVSKDTHESGSYFGEIEKKNYEFWPVDRSEIDGRFGIRYKGYSTGIDGKVKDPTLLYGAFEIFGCKGVPEKFSFPGNFKHYFVPDQTERYPVFMKYVELEEEKRFDKENDFSLVRNGYQNQSINHTAVEYLMRILDQTPGIFKIAMPWSPCLMDRLLMDIPKSFRSSNVSYFMAAVVEREIATGTWLPFFYADRQKTFFTLPMFLLNNIKFYYPEIKKGFKTLKDAFEKNIRQMLQGFKPSSEEIMLLGSLAKNFNAIPPSTREELIELLVKYYMQYINLYLGYLNLALHNSRKFHFKNDYHPFVCNFAKLVYNPLKGIPALMSREMQMKNTGFSFLKTYQPTENVLKIGTEDYYPKEDVDFSPDGAYSPYNWELFFHAPLMIANRLSKEQRFEEAMQWYHYIFNPIGVEGTLPDGKPAGAPQKYWIAKPFFLTTDELYKKQRIDSILRMLAGDTTTDGFTAALKKELEDQVRDWRDNPFEPHRIAQYRTVAYQKTTVMKYLDNLIAWGDYLFRQDSMESINEATQLYIMAAEILGPRPKKIPPQIKPAVETYNELENQFDSFSNALVQVENLIPVMPGDGQDGGDAAPLPMLYFCIP